MRLHSARKLSTRLLLGLLLPIALSAVARTEERLPEPIVIGARHPLASKVLGEQLLVDIHLPPGYSSSSERCPVVIVLDPGQHFRHVAATADYLARARAIPSLIVVGVHSSNRRRDLTPTKVRSVPDSGGADGFLRFLTDELVPWLDARYRTAPYRIVVGQSWGGLFGIHALVQRPDAIQACIALEPKLDWDGGVVAKSFETAFAERKTWRGFLHLARAGQSAEPSLAATRVLALARGPLPERFEFRVRLQTEDSLNTLGLAAVSDGLRALYRLWPSEPITLKSVKLEDLVARSEALSNHFGYEIPVPELDLNALGYRLLALDRTEEALTVLERNVRTWPKSANVYDSLGDALDRAGDKRRALVNYTMACRLGRAQDSPLLSLYMQNQARLRELVADLR